MSPPHYLFVVYMHIHAAKYAIGKYSVNPNKKKLKIHYEDRKEFLHGKIRINHYYCKSYEEFLLKRNRGMADKTGIVPMQNFHDHDRNEIKNDSTMDKYIPLIYKNLEQRYNK